MADSAEQSTESQTSGGFRIEVTSSGLTVAEINPRMFTPANCLLYGVLCFALYLAYRPDPLMVVLFLAIMGLPYWFGKAHNMRCTHQVLEVIDVRRGRTVQTSSYSRAEVNGIKFGAVAYSRYGAQCGLIFEVAGKRIKMLYGLKCVEAQKILHELQNLGFDVCLDVGMPMMVEMELSRRNSWLGRWFV